jgi:hypothetical protein
MYLSTASFPKLKALPAAEQKRVVRSALANHAPGFTLRFWMSILAAIAVTWTAGIVLRPELWGRVLINGVAWGLVYAYWLSQINGPLLRAVDLELARQGEGTAPGCSD